VLDNLFDDLEKKSSAFKMPEFAPVMEFGAKAMEMPPFMKEMLAKADKYKAAERKGPPKAEVYIENARFDIRQAFAEGFDPDRIAAAFVDQIGSTALYQGQSSFAAAGTGA
jgi:hypothetical protein